MARRIVITMLALVSALLILAVAPLGVVTAGREQDSFRMQALMNAHAMAGAAEQRIDNPRHHTPDRALTTSLESARQRGDQVWVYDANGQLVTQTGGADRKALPAPQGAGAAVATVLHDRDYAPSEIGGRLRVVVSIGSNENSPDGAVLLSRPTRELHSRLHMLWAWLSAVAAIGLLAAALAAVLLARWVGRPLSALDAAAQQLGGGALATRSGTGHGPPEVRRLAQTFNTMAGRLEALVHGNRAMMTDVSHQLRTPLAALRLRLDLLTQDADQATASELAAAQGEIARLSRLVDGLLAIARAENVVSKPVEVAVDAVIQDRAAAWGPVAEERGIWLTTRCLTRVRAALGDGHLEQILDNLLANALDVVPSGGQVRVTASANSQGARITVADDGPGMSKAQQEAAFRRFVSTSPAGAGLGLAIVHRLVTANGGAAALSDTAGGGLTVTLDLPGGQPDRMRRAGVAVSGLNSSLLNGF
jgi:signal transduction histidine kinase